MIMVIRTLAILSHILSANILMRKFTDNLIIVNATGNVTVNVLYNCEHS